MMDWEQLWAEGMETDDLFSFGECETFTGLTRPCDTSSLLVLERVIKSNDSIDDAWRSVFHTLMTSD